VSDHAGGGGASRILLTVWPLTGHLHPNLALAGALRRAGHDVAFYTGASAAPLIEREGFRLFPFQRLDERTVERIVLSPAGILAAGRRPWRRRALWTRWALDTLPEQVADLRDVIASWRPGAIMTDPTLWAPFLVLHELTGVPVAVFSLIPACHLAGRDAPILGFPLPRPRGPLGRARARVLRSASEGFLRPVRAAATAVRARYGLPPLDCSVTDFAGRMPLYLVPGSRGFDYDRDDLPASVEYVGPCLWDGGRADSPPAWLRDLPADEPLVYVSEGTVNLEPRVLRAAADGLAGLPIQVVITTGRHRDPASLGLAAGTAGNVRVERWVPLVPLLPRLGAIVTVGGPSTLLAGLDAGVPAVIVPSDWDHPETAWRLAASGAGIRLAPRACTPRRLRRAVTRVLEDPGYRLQARRLAAEFRAAGGPERAAALVGELARASGARGAAREERLAWRAS
jgi:MGT family glycosyltransferase